MNIFIGENNLKDYVFLKSIIEKWGIEKQQEIYFHWYKQLYYQLPKCLKNCDLVFLELDMKHINGFEFAKILRKKDLDRKSTRLNSSHMPKSRMPSSA